MRQVHTPDILATEVCPLCCVDQLKSQPFVAD
jgi:hypothetical protein